MTLDEQDPKETVTQKDTQKAEDSHSASTADTELKMQEIQDNSYKYFTCHCAYFAQGLGSVQRHIMSMLTVPHRLHHHAERHPCDAHHAEKPEDCTNR